MTQDLINKWSNQSKQQAITFIIIDLYLQFDTISPGLNA